MVAFRECCSILAASRIRKCGKSIFWKPKALAKPGNIFADRRLYAKKWYCYKWRLITDDIIHIFIQIIFMTGIHFYLSYMNVFYGMDPFIFLFFNICLCKNNVYLKCIKYSLFVEIIITWDYCHCLSHLVKWNNSYYNMY